MGKIISSKEVQRKYRDWVDFDGKNSIGVEINEKRMNLYFNEKRQRIESYICFVREPDGSLKPFKLDNLLFAARNMFDENYYSAVLSIDDKNLKYTYKKPYDSSYSFIFICRTRDAILQVVLYNAMVVGGNLSGVYVNYGYKGANFDQVNEGVAALLTCISNTAFKNDLSDSIKQIQDKTTHKIEENSDI